MIMSIFFPIAVYCPTSNDCHCNGHSFGTNRQLHFDSCRPHCRNAYEISRYLPIFAGFVLSAESDLNN